MGSRARLLVVGVFEVVCMETGGRGEGGAKVKSFPFSRDNLGNGDLCLGQEVAGLEGGGGVEWIAPALGGGCGFPHAGVKGVVCS